MGAALSAEPGPRAEGRAPKGAHARRRGGDGALHAAAREGTAAALAAALSALPEGAPRAAAANAADRRGRTPLHAAAKRGRAGCVRALLAAGADPLAVDGDGCTCLHLAALRRLPQTISQILDLVSASDPAAARRLVDARTASGLTALSYAAWTSSEPCARALLERGAGFDAAAAANAQPQDAHALLPLGSGPLHIAAIRGDARVAGAILERYAIALARTPRGARPPPDPRCAANARGHTPADVARAHGAAAALVAALKPGLPVGRVVDVASLLRNTGPRPLKELAAAAWRAHLLSALNAARAATAGAAPAAAGPLSAGAVCAAAEAVACFVARAGGGASPDGAAPPGLSRACSDASSATCWLPLSGPPSGGPSSGGPTSADSFSALGGGGGGCAALCVLRQSSLASSCSADAELSIASCGAPRCLGGAPGPAWGGPGYHRYPPGPAGGGVGGAAGWPGCLDSDDDDSGSEGGGDCGVCFEPLRRAPSVRLRGCGHALCGGCARGVVCGGGDCAKAAGTACPTCPFCRARIAGFEPA
ncbi:hypothetical protein Rsub_05772 [Raphidocelis subcapitata]|uniref:RING-type domain-containing protein n=1 Tax=Raphidocelis subcapitata TaxID=307507 RepID=A0A2V0NZ94_9CHLO|nr:hypothetical protein Rsub_05772 [Raphidocelis subcapitata]|eukprot:GBF92936.1 hypothetical protein Rsub_05772 [Raphidocelis subcapitata]